MQQETPTKQPHALLSNRDSSTSLVCSSADSTAAPHRLQPTPTFGERDSSHFFFYDHIGD
jgi:hypothetical protein